LRYYFSYKQMARYNAGLFILEVTVQTIMRYQTEYNTWTPYFKTQLWMRPYSIYSGFEVVLINPTIMCLKMTASCIKIFSHGTESRLWVELNAVDPGVSFVELRSNIIQELKHCGIYQVGIDVD